MYSFATYKEQYKANLRLALPVVLTQLGQILTQVADNLMVGRYGGSDPTPLAAVSFGGAVFFILFIAAIGIALGMTPLVGELYAQGDREKSSGLLQNGILFYGLLGVAMAAVQYAVIPLMYHLGQPAEVVDMAIPYYRMLVWSMPFIMLFFTFKQFLEGVGNTKVEMFVTIAANLAKGYDLDTAVQRAKAYLSGALAAMLDLGAGSGPMDHAFDLKPEYRQEAGR